MLSCTEEETDLEYSEFVFKLKKPGEEILTTLTPMKCDLMHMAMGISGEAGELLDAVKKYIIYQKPLDLENVKEEIGDLNFFLEGILQNLSISKKEVIDLNKAKLSKRYAKGTYTDVQAQERADKDEPKSRD
jgi:NTP pyrophosphatase (non-canonical NTP hydrolase)